jgi:hypothetical protein
MLLCMLHQQKKSTAVHEDSSRIVPQALMFFVLCYASPLGHTTAASSTGRGSKHIHVFPKQLRTLHPGQMPMVATLYRGFIKALIPSLIRLYPVNTTQ